MNICADEDRDVIYLLKDSKFNILKYEKIILLFTPMPC